MALYLAYEQGYEQGCKERQRSYQDGYDKAVDMACEWLEGNLPQCIEIENGYVAVKNYFIADFKKTMKGGKQ